jgi:hypothetical protein
MSKKRIEIPGRGGKIRIKSSSESHPDDDDQPVSPDDWNGIEISESDIINQIESKAISQVRPDDDDVEMLYALTGRSRQRVDGFHSLASANIVSEANYDSISYDPNQVVSYIDSELNDTPALFVLVHTHPRRSRPQPSSADRANWDDVASVYKSEWPDVRVCYGIHAFTEEFSRPKGREQPTRLAGDTTLVEWRSPTRDHAFRLYTPAATGIEVKIV